MVGNDITKAIIALKRKNDDASFFFHRNLGRSAGFLTGKTNRNIKSRSARTQAKEVQLTSSARILVLELRDILDYALVLLEPPPPPPPESEMFGEGGEIEPSSSPNGGDNQVTNLS